MSAAYCQTQYNVYLNKLGMFNQQTVLNAYNELVSNNCPQAVGLAPPAGSSTTPPPSPPPHTVTPPPPNPCAQYQAAYTDALSRNDGIGQLNAANGLCANACPMPTRWHCGTTGAYWNPDPSSTTPPPTTPDITPTHTPPPAPSKCDILSSQYLMAKSQGNSTAINNAIQQLCALNCSMPAGATCPLPPAPASYCTDYQAAFDTAVANSDIAGMQAAIRNMCLAGCKLPAGWTCDNEGNGPATGGNGGSGTTPSGGGVQPVGPPVNPCTGEQSLTLVDYLVTLPLSGLKDDPILALVIGAAGAAGGLVSVTILIPEAGLYARIPAASLGLYGGLIVNGILDNYDWIKNAEKYGIVFGTLVSGLGAVSGIYQSIHNSTEKFLKTELGGVAGELVYKVGEGIISGGLFPVYDILFGDKTWTTAGYDKAKCDAGCEDPSLSSTKRKLCKLGARLDLKF